MQDGRQRTGADEVAALFQYVILWYGGGMKYHLLDNFCNFALAYQRMELQNAPAALEAVRSSANQFTFAAQLLYC